MGKEGTEEGNTVPSLRLADLRYWLNCTEAVVSSKEKEEHATELKEALEAKAMTPLYRVVAEELAWKVEDATLAELRARNEAKVVELNANLVDAEENLGESEVRAALLAQSEYYCQIGAKELTLEAYRKTLEKTVGPGEKLDVVFALIRVGFFWNDRELVVRNLDKAREMLVTAGDWDRRNRSRVYEGVQLMASRNWEKAAGLFLEALATFTCVELCTFEQFVFYTVVVALPSLPRPELKSRVIDSPDVLSVIDSLPGLGDLLNSFYNLDYQTFFQSLAVVTDTMKKDRYLGALAGYFCREMRIKAYCQLLESYSSLQLSALAESFGVSEAFIDAELSRFINAGRIHCKIDAVHGTVETIRSDARNAEYQATIKQGDALMHRIQKLSRVI